MRFEDGSATGQLKGIKKKDGAWVVCDLDANGNALDDSTHQCVSMATFSLTGVSLDDLLFVELYLKGDEGNTLWKWYLNLDSTLLLGMGATISHRVGVDDSVILASNDTSSFLDGLFSVATAHASTLANELTVIPNTVSEYFIDIGEKDFTQGVTIAAHGFLTRSFATYPARTSKVELEIPWDTLPKSVALPSDPSFDPKYLGECKNAFTDGVTPCGIEIASRLAGTLPLDGLDTSPVEFNSAPGVSPNAEAKAAAEKTVANAERFGGNSVVKLPVIVKHLGVFVPVNVKLENELSKVKGSSFGLSVVSLFDGSPLLYRFDTAAGTTIVPHEVADTVRQALLNQIGSVYEELYLTTAAFGADLTGNLEWPGFVEFAFSDNVRAMLDFGGQAQSNLFNTVAKDTWINATDVSSLSLPADFETIVVESAQLYKGVEPLTTTEREVALRDYARVWRSLVKLVPIFSEKLTIPRPISGEGCGLLSNKGVASSSDVKFSIGADCVSPEVEVNFGDGVDTKGHFIMTYDGLENVGEAKFRLATVDYLHDLFIRMSEEETHFKYTSDITDVVQANVEVTDNSAGTNAIVHVKPEPVGDTQLDLYASYTENSYDVRPYHQEKFPLSADDKLFIGITATGSGDTSSHETKVKGKDPAKDNATIDSSYGIGYGSGSGVQGYIDTTIKTDFIYTSFKVQSLAFDIDPVVNFDLASSNGRFKLNVFTVPGKQLEGTKIPIGVSLGINPLIEFWNGKIKANVFAEAGNLDGDCPKLIGIGAGIYDIQATVFAKTSNGVCPSQIQGEYGASSFNNVPDELLKGSSSILFGLRYEFQ